MGGKKAAPEPCGPTLNAAEPLSRGHHGKQWSWWWEESLIRFPAYFQRGEKSQWPSPLSSPPSSHSSSQRLLHDFSWLEHTDVMRIFLDQMWLTIFSHFLTQRHWKVCLVHVCLRSFTCCTKEKPTEDPCAQSLTHRQCSIEIKNKSSRYTLRYVG